MKRYSTGNRSCPLHAAALFGLICFLCGSAWAETVVAPLPDGTVAGAEFHAGQPSRPAVLLLHGFLQTRHAPPISRLATALADQGYTVLSPTLSLGIDRRAQSLACEAVHAHTHDRDIAEIDFWIKWLVGKGYANIAVIGHSLGSGQLLHYLAQKPHTAVKKALLTSLIPVRSSAQQSSRPAGQQALGRFTLSFCRNNYVAPRHAFQTYAETGSAARILQQIGKTQVPVEVILGGADTAMAKSWPAAVRKNGAAVRVIRNAGHFFDGDQEFDLMDSVESGLKPLAAEK